MDNSYYKQFFATTNGLMSRVFANGSGDRGSIPSLVFPKTQKILLDAAMLKTQQYKVRIKGPWIGLEKSREWCSALPDTLVFEKRDFGSPTYIELTPNIFF